MKRKLLATLGLFAATCIAAPAFASSSPPTATLDLRPAAYGNAKTAIDSPLQPNIGAKADVDYTGNLVATTSAPPGWSAGIAKLDARGGGKALVITRAGDEIYGISVGLSPRPGDSATKYIGAASDTTNSAKILLAAAPPANGFTREDVIAAGSLNSAMGIGAA